MIDLMSKELYEYQISSTSDTIEKIEEMVTKYPALTSCQVSLERLRAQKNELEKEMKEKYGE